MIMIHGKLSPICVDSATYFADTTLVGEHCIVLRKSEIEFLFQFRTPNVPHVSSSPCNIICAFSFRVIYAPLHRPGAGYFSIGFMPRFAPRFGNLSLTLSEDSHSLGSLNLTRMFSSVPELGISVPKSGRTSGGLISIHRVNFGGTWPS